MRALTGMGLLSAAMLLLQVALTRFFSIAQFYHFAFLVISLALLGFGASGSLLALWPRLRRPTNGAGYALGFALSTLAAALFANHLPFDSYSIAWDGGQVVLLAGNLLALAVPFVFAGALIAALLGADTAHAGRTYAANLLGSAAGAILAPLVLAGLGSERAVLLCAALGAAAGLILAGSRRMRLLAGAGTILAAALLIDFPAAFEVRPSPYKALSQFRLNPEATITATRQNAYARLDIVTSPTIRAGPQPELPRPPAGADRTAGRWRRAAARGRGRAGFGSGRPRPARRGGLRPAPGRPGPGPGFGRQPRPLDGPGDHNRKCDRGRAQRPGL